MGGFLNRLGSTWYYTLFVAAVLLFLLCKGFIYDIIYENIRDAGKEGRVPTLVLKKEKEQELVVATVAGAMHSGATKKLLSDRSLAKGYRIEDNSDYFEVLAIMDRLKQRKLKRDMSKAVATPRGL